MAPLDAVWIRGPEPKSESRASHGGALGTDMGRSSVPSHAGWVAWLEAHPNWTKLGPKRKEIVVLLVLNELDTTTGVLSTLTNRELAKKYPGYNKVQFKNTFAALRHYGIARPEERFVPAQFGRLQTGTRYTLVESEDGKPWSTGDFRAVRSRKAAVARRERNVGRLTFTPAEDEQLRHTLRLRHVTRAANGLPRPGRQPQGRRFPNVPAVKVKGSGSL